MSHSFSVFGTSTNASDAPKFIHVIGDSLKWTVVFCHLWICLNLFPYLSTVPEFYIPNSWKAASKF